VRLVFDEYTIISTAISRHLPPVAMNGNHDKEAAEHCWFFPARSDSQERKRELGSWLAA
jgi:hypothetical protein